MFIILYLGGGFLLGKLLFFFLQEKLEVFKNSMFCGNVCNFSVLSSFVSSGNIFRPRFMETT